MRLYSELQYKNKMYLSNCFFGLKGEYVDRLIFISNLKMIQTDQFAFQNYMSICFPLS